MPGKFMDIGERKLLEGGVASLGVLTLKLVREAFTIVEPMTPGDLTEANYVGYAGLELTFDGLEVGNPGGKAVAKFLPLEFVCGGPETPNDIYGFFVEDADGDVIAAERYAGSARRMRIAGSTLEVVFQLRLYSPF